MNYYEHHIRDYDAATSHLTWDEDLAYSRLIRWYYRKEQPIPADLKEACRQVRAATKIQRDAVQSVLNEFFVLREDGWHNETCDEAINRFKEGEPEREVKKANEENRLRRHRDERARLFKIITDAGEHAHWNTGMETLREIAERIQNATPATAPATLFDKPETLPATAPATPATATQSPDTNHQPPVVNKPISVVALTEDQPPPADPPPDHTTRGELCKKLRTLCVDAAPHLQAWGELSAFSDDEILAVAEIAKAKKPNERIHLNYLVPILKDRATVKPTAKREPPWWSSNDLMLAKGVEVGLSPRPGEDWPQFRGRINEKLSQGVAA